MSATNSIISGIGQSVSSTIVNGAAVSVSIIRSGARTIVVRMLSTATNTSLTEEPCPVTLEEGLAAEREFRVDPIFGDGEGIYDNTHIQQGTLEIEDDFEVVSADIHPAGFLPFDSERVVEEGKRNLHQVMYHIVMHLSAQNHPVVNDVGFLTRMSEIISAWYFTPPNEACLRWTEVTMLLSQHHVIDFDDPTDDVLVLLRRRY
jgi:hypothetical protein